MLKTPVKRRAQDSVDTVAPAEEYTSTTEDPQLTGVSESTYGGEEPQVEEAGPEEGSSEELEEGAEADQSYYEPNYEEPEEPQADQAVGTFDVNFESEEIKETLAMIEYKMTEVNELMKECIEQEFAADLMADKDQVMTECVGLTYQILFFNYEESMRRVKQIFLELLKEKLSKLSEHYLDETEFFLDVLEDFVDKDYIIIDSLEIAKDTSKYYVSPRFFDNLIDIAKPEIDAFHELHNRLKKSRTEIQDLMDEKLREREKYLESLKGEVTKLESVVEEPIEEMAPPEHSQEIYDGDYEEEAEPIEESEYHPEEEEHDEEEEEPEHEEELEHHALESGENDSFSDSQEEGGSEEGGSEGGNEGEEQTGGGGESESEGGAEQSEHKPTLAAPEGNEERLRRMFGKKFRLPFKGKI